MTLMTEENVSARDRLLASANELFYNEGVHTVGINRVIEHAGVAKATLYSAFGGKDGLVRAYLTERYELQRKRYTEGLAMRNSSAKNKLIEIFEIQGEAFARPGYRGCAFVGANAETSPGSAPAELATQFRGWVRNLFVALATEAGIKDVEALVDQLVVLYDGASVSAWMDHNQRTATASVAAATMLVTAAMA